MRIHHTPALPSVLIAAKASLVGALWAYSAMEGVSSIATFSSGALTLLGVTDKSRDYVSAGAFGLTAVISFIAAYEFLSRSAARAPSNAARSLHRSLMFANIPAFYALGQMVFSQQPAIPLIALSLVGELVLLASFGMFLVRKGLVETPPAEPDPPLLFDWVLPVLLFSLIAGALTPASWAAFMAVRDQAPVGPAELIGISKLGKKVFLGVAAIACISLFFFMRSATAIQKGGCVLLALAQVVLLAGAVRLVGPLLVSGDHLQYAVMLSVEGKSLLAAVTLVSMGHIIVLAKSILRSHDPQLWIRSGAIVTPLAAGLTGLVLKVDLDKALLNLADEYHTGEFVLPYWSWKTFGLLPYVDLAPARGWVNVLFGWIAEEGIGPQYVSYAYTGIYVTLLSVLFLFLALQWAIGTWPAFLLICFAPAANGISEIDVANTGLLAIICRASMVLRPTIWLGVWVVLGTAAVLFAPGQGALLVVATGILGAVQFRSAIRTEPKLLGRTAVAGLLMAAMLAWLTPLAQMIFGAVRYGLEQSAANTEANGIPWSIGAGTGPVTSKALWEAYRLSWLMVTISIGAAVYLGARRAGRNFIASPSFIIGMPIVLLGLLFIPRAAGRIDPGLWSRPGVASVWFVSLLLPLFLFFSQKNRAGPLAVLSLVALLGSMSPLVGTAWSTDPFAGVAAVQNLVDGRSVGLDRLGTAIMDPGRVENYAKLKRFVDSEIGPSQTFVDLTNRSSLYYLLNRRPPIEVAAYNLTNLRQQARTIRTLEINPPPLALASSNNILHDGGPLSLRANALYRYVIENYRPVNQDEAIWLKRDKEVGIRGGARERVLSNEEIGLLTRAFRPRELGALPRAWGRAWKTLHGQLSAPLPLQLEAVSLHHIQRAPNGDLISLGHDPFFMIDVSGENIIGAEKGILSFDFACIDGRKPPTLEVFWSNDLIPEFSGSASAVFEGQNGRLIVPLDAFPTWVLGGRVKSLRFDLVDPSSCGSWRVGVPILAQRSALAPIRQLWLR